MCPQGHLPLSVCQISLEKNVVSFCVFSIAFEGKPQVVAFFFPYQVKRWTQEVLNERLRVSTAREPSPFGKCYRLQNRSN